MLKQTRRAAVVLCREAAALPRLGMPSSPSCLRHAFKLNSSARVFALWRKLGEGVFSYLWPWSTYPNTVCELGVVWRSRCHRETKLAVTPELGRRFLSRSEASFRPSKGVRAKCEQEIWGSTPSDALVAATSSTKNLSRIFGEIE